MAIDLKPESANQFNYGLAKHAHEHGNACSIADCLHTAHEHYIVGERRAWFCKCHDPINPSDCYDALRAKSNMQHTHEGDCVFCGSPRSDNIMHGIDGSIRFICSACYSRPIGETRKYYRATHPDAHSRLP